MGVDGFRNHLDLHACKRLRGIDEPLHFGFLTCAVQYRQISDFGVEECTGLFHPGKRRSGSEAKRKREYRC